MAALGLGAIEDFPFLDPPDRRQVRDGLNLLQELGALDAQDPGRRLTPIGRRLAQLPVDPRLARMVLEADRLGCADEVIVIAAGLSIQDPRERPVEKQAQADQSHARFADEHSDFISYLNLWRHLRERQRELSGSQFRKLCHAEYLHYLRVREWQDLVGQLRQAAKEVGVKLNRTPAEPADVHVALLSGLLSHLGLKDGDKREYQGARGARFALWPGSALARRPPTWVMVGELVETSRLWGRDVARIDPKWAEPLAEHLVKRTYSEPRWQPRRGAVVATERVTLYGLPIVAGRTVAYGRIEPELSRELFLRRALVEGEWETRHPFFAANQRLVEEVQRLEERARRRDILVSDQVLFDFFDARIPSDVVSGAHFDRWWRDARRRDPELLSYTRELLISSDATDALGAGGRPTGWRQGDLTLPLSYRFEPGAPDDGVTVHVPLRALAGLRPDGFEWLVPAFRRELVTTLVRSLPKELRKRLVPVPDVAARVLEALEPRREPLLAALEREIEAQRGVRIPRSAWDLSRLPAHLRMTFRVQDDDGNVLAEGKDLEAVRAAARPRLRAELASETASLERHGLRAWTIGTLPREVALPGTADAVRAYPALVDEGDAVGVRSFETPAAQSAAMWPGTRRLLRLTSPPPGRRVLARLGRAGPLSLSTAPHDSVAAVIEDATVAAADALIAQADGPAWDEAGFARLRSHFAGNLAGALGDVLVRVVAILDARRDVQRRLEELRGEAFAPARTDVARQLGRLVHPGFIAATGVARLPDVERYLRAAERRLEQLPNTLAIDRDRMRAINQLEAEYERVRDTRRTAALTEVRWMLEELRVNQFAQALGTRGQVSSKRIRRALEEAAGAARA